jgi:DNA repair ATPase RecN
MLDVFKKSGSSRQQSDELQTLIAASKEERAALSTMLTQVQLHGAKIVAAGKTLQEVEEKVAKAQTRLDELQDRLNKADARAKELESVETRIKALTDAVGQAARVEELLDRVEKLAREVGGQLDAGAKARGGIKPLRKNARPDQKQKLA